MDGDLRKEELESLWKLKNENNLVIQQADKGVEILLIEFSFATKQSFFTFKTIFTFELVVLPWGPRRTSI